MILERKSDKTGPYYRLGLIERSSLTLENYAASQIGRRFYTEEFLKGFSERRNAIHAQAAKSAISTALLATVLAFFESLNGTVTFLGITFSMPPAGAAALSVLVSMSLLGALIAQLDQLLIDRYMNTLGNRIGMYSFELPLLNYSTLNLWVTALTPRHFGLASGAGHQLAFAFTSLLMLALGLVFLCFPAVVVVFRTLDILRSEPQLLEQILCYFSLFLNSLTALFFLTFALKYKFRPTGTAEPTDPIIPEDFLDLGHPRSQSDDDPEGGSAG